MTKEEFFTEIDTARVWMGSNLTTPRQWDAMILRLGQLSISPDLDEKWRDVAFGQLRECTMRKIWTEARNSAK